MGKLVYKIEINLRKRTGSMAVVSGRADDGSIVRSVGLVPNRESMVSLVDSALEAVASYDPKEHARAHQLAIEAARAQRDEQAVKVEK